MDEISREQAQRIQSALDEDATLRRIPASRRLHRNRYLYFASSFALALLCIAALRLKLAQEVEVAAYLGLFLAVALLGAAYYTWDQALQDSDPLLAHLAPTMLEFVEPLRPDADHPTRPVEFPPMLIGDSANTKQKRLLSGTFRTTPFTLIRLNVRNGEDTGNTFGFDGIVLVFSLDAPVWGSFIVCHAMDRKWRLGMLNPFRSWQTLSITSDHLRLVSAASVSETDEQWSPLLRAARYLAACWPSVMTRVAVSGHTGYVMLPDDDRASLQFPALGDEISIKSDVMRVRTNIYRLLQAMDLIASKETEPVAGVVEAVA